MKKSINTFADHAPKPEWIQDFILKQESFLNDHSLGPVMIPHFKKFLKEAGLYDKRYNLTSFNTLISKIGWNSLLSWSLIYTNLVYNNVQMRWYVDNLPLDVRESRDYVEGLLTSLDISSKDASSITKAFKRLCETPLGTVLNMGCVYMEGNSYVALQRSSTDCREGDAVLYCLLRMSDLEGKKQYNLEELVSNSSDGVSPVVLFGLSESVFTSLLNGLSIEYPEFINASFTHGLNKIMISDDKTADDFLNLLGSKYD